MNGENFWEFQEYIGTISYNLTETLQVVTGPYYGRYLINVQAKQKQEHKAWLVENGFILDLWTKTNEDHLKGLPPIIIKW